MRKITLCPICKKGMIGRSAVKDHKECIKEMVDYLDNEDMPETLDKQYTKIKKGLKKNEDS